MNYVSRTLPRVHQLKALELTRGKKVFAYLCEMGTGKSKMVIDEWGERVAEGRVHDLLIVAPAGSYRNWDQDKSDEIPSQLRAHLDPELFKTITTCAWVSGMGVNAKKRLETFLMTFHKPRVFVVNVEALSSTTEAVKACEAFLRAPERRSMFAVDESTVIKNDGAIRTKEVIALKDYANIRRILTGMVSPRSPMDLYSQFEFLDWRILGHSSIYSFKRRYCILEKSRVLDRDKLGQVKKDSEGKAKWRDFEVIVGYRNVEELQKKIAPFSYRVLKSDCLDLPPKIYMRREVTLTEEQKRVYNDLVLFSTAQLDNAAHVTTNMVIQKMLRLHQIVCGHTVDEEGNEHDVKSNRISSLIELLEEHAGKVVIWVNYRREIDKIVAALEKEYGLGSVAQFHGGNHKTRGKEEADFLSNPMRRFMVSTQSAGGRGNTWVNANMVVYFSNNHDLELRMQSEDRCHRDGLKHTVTYVDMVAPRSVDEKILASLRKKLNMATLISGEGYREWIV